MREERIVLDPKEVAFDDRAEIDLHSSILVGEAGPDWGQQEINHFLAKLRMGEIPIDSEFPNRTIKIPLLIGVNGNLDADRIALQAKAGRINEEGGWLKREMIGGSYGEAGERLFADLVKATVRFSDDTTAASDGIDANAELILEALPDFYGEEEVLSVHEATGVGAFTEMVKGNLPGRVNLAVTEATGKDQAGLAWAFRCRNYSAASTAKAIYEAEALQKLGAATESTRTGASGGKVIRLSSLGTDWTPVLGTALGGTEDLTHQGVYDVWARVFTTSAIPPYLRLAYNIGDWVNPECNPSVQVPDFGNFYLVNLGQINLRRLPIGKHRWQGMIQARGAGGGENIDIDRLYFFCADEGSGIVRANTTAAIEVPINGYAARDEFNQTAGNLKGKTLPTGGTWNLAGDLTPEAVVDAKLDRAVRSAATDEELGSIYTASTPSVGTVVVSVDMFISSSFKAGEFEGGPVARFTNAESLVAAVVQGLWVGGGDKPALFLLIREGGVDDFAGPFFLNTVKQGQWMTVKLVLLPNFNYMLYAGPQGDPELLAAGWDTSLQGANVSAPGKVGFISRHLSAGALESAFDNFQAWEPALDAAVYSKRSITLSDRGAFRETALGTYYSPVSYPSSDLPRIPVSGPEERPVEVVLKPSRGDFDTLADSGLDKFTAQLGYRPCWSDIPG